MIQSVCNNRIGKLFHRLFTTFDLLEELCVVNHSANHVLIRRDNLRHAFDLYASHLMVELAQRRLELRLRDDTVANNGAVC